MYIHVCILLNLKMHTRQKCVGTTLHVALHVPKRKTPSHSPWTRVHLGHHSFSSSHGRNWGAIGLSPSFKQINLLDPTWLAVFTQN